MKTYVLAIAFGKQAPEVLVIEKQKPDWQKGMFNGIVAEATGNPPGPTQVSNIAFQQVGIMIPEKEWNYFATYHAPLFHLHCFSCQTNKIYSALKSGIIEQDANPIKIYSYMALLRHPKLVPSLKTLLPLAIQSITKKDWSFSSITEVND